jgi:hypothetical protein
MNTASPIFTESYDKPGRYVIELPVSPPEAVNLIISMTNEHGQYFEDMVYISVGSDFYKWLKYLVLSPVVLLAFQVFFLQNFKLFDK